MIKPIISGVLDRPQRYKQSNRVFSTKGIAPTLLAAMGIGGAMKY